MSLGHECFVFGETPNFFAPFETAEAQVNKDDAFCATLLAFKGNLASAFQVASIPYQLVHVAVLDQRFAQLHVAENIRSLKTVDPGESPSEEAKQRAFLKARERHLEELRDPSLLQRHAEKTLSVLESHLENDGFRASADELRLQVLVMSWGAFEAFFSDLIRDLLNKKPTLMRELMLVKEYRDLVLGRNFVDTLAMHGFNLSDRMGDIFCSAVKLDGLEAIKTVAEKVFGSAEAEKVLKSSELWKIAQQRHLIVHRRAIVDMHYVERTGDRVSVGVRLLLATDYLEEAMATLRDVGLCCFRCAIEARGID